MYVNSLQIRKSENDGEKRIFHNDEKFYKSLTLEQDLEFPVCDLVKGRR